MSRNIAFLCSVLLDFSAKLGVRFTEAIKLKSYTEALTIKRMHHEFYSNRNTSWILLRTWKNLNKREVKDWNLLTFDI